MLTPSATKTSCWVHNEDVLQAESGLEKPNGKENTAKAGSNDENFAVAAIWHRSVDRCARINPRISDKIAVSVRSTKVDILVYALGFEAFVTLRGILCLII